MMRQMAREVASRVLEEGAQCLLWETSQEITVDVCRQAAGGVAAGVESRVGRGRCRKSADSGSRGSER